MTKEPKIKTTTAPKKTKEGKIIYTIKAIIPTGPYSNIQPEITMEASSVEQAESVLMPHIKQLFTEYTNYIEKNPPQPSVRVTPPVVVPETPKQEPKSPEETPFDKAMNRVISVNDPEALILVQEQVYKSTKLTEVQKLKLYEIINAKLPK